MSHIKAQILKTLTEKCFLFNFFFWQMFKIFQSSKLSLVSKSFEMFLKGQNLKTLDPKVNIIPKNVKDS